MQGFGASGGSGPRRLRFQGMMLFLGGPLAIGSNHSRRSSPRLTYLLMTSRGLVTSSTITLMTSVRPWPP
eukprot:7578582-Pyramimonas_sp.AAC.1